MQTAVRALARPLTAIRAHAFALRMLPAARAASTESASRRNVLAEQFNFTPIDKTNKAASKKAAHAGTGASRSKDQQQTAIADLPPPPPGVSLKFHQEQFLLVERMHNAILSEGLSALAAFMQTPQDVEIFRPIMREWRIKGHFFPYAERNKIVTSLCAIGAFDALLDIYCDYPGYRFVPSPTDLMKLFEHYAASAITPSARSNEKEHIQALDRLYKCFAVGLYHNIPPSPRQYSLLIAAGAYGSTAEGLRRSVITARELASLGWSLDDAAVCALAYGHVAAGDMPAALAALAD